MRGSVGPPAPRTEGSEGLTPRATAAERFDALYRETFTSVYAYCRRRVHPPSDVDDVVAEVYAAVWRRLDDALAAEIPLAWIYGVAYRTIANSRRGRRRRLRLVDRANRTPDRPRVNDPAVDIVDADTGERLRADLSAALTELSHVDREIVLLSAWEQLSQNEIAAIVGLSPKAVRTRLYRARKQLERTIRRDNTDEVDTESAKADGERRTPRDEQGEDS